MSATGSQFVDVNKAKEASLSDFSRLSKGEAIVIFLGNVRHDKIVWTHDRVERDLIFGTAQLPNGLTLPVDCYMENTGYRILFDTFNPQGSKEGFTEGIGGSVFLAMPVPSQLPERWQPSEKGPQYGKFDAKARKSIEAFVDDLINKGFSAGPGRVITSGFDFTLPIWNTSWHKQGCAVRLFVRQERQGFLKSTKYFVSVIDHSHRPSWKSGTTLIETDGLSLAEAVHAMSSGIDLAWSKSQ